MSDYRLAASKFDADKPRVDLVPVQGILAAARAFTFGAKKYSPWNWTKGLEWLRLYGAVLRHLFEFSVGHTKDKESGLHPLDHALASLLMLQAHVELGLGKDDRAHMLRGVTAAIPAAHVPKTKEVRYQCFVRGEDKVWYPSLVFSVPFVSREIAEKVLANSGYPRIAFELREVEIG